MNLDNNEIEEIGNAFVTIGYLDYTPEQQDFLIGFLKNYGQTLNDEHLTKIFHDQAEIREALKKLHLFAKLYKEETTVYPEFQEEIEELIVNLNGKEEGIIL